MYSEGRRWIMKRHFQGLPTLDDFELKTEPLHPLRENEILIEPEYWSVDPYARIYPASFGFKLPMTMLGSQVSRVLASRHPRYPVDSHVLAYTGWREVAALDPDKHYDTYGRGPTALPRVSCHWRRAGHVTSVLTSDWSRWPPPWSCPTRCPAPCCWAASACRASPHISASCKSLLTLHQLLSSSSDHF